jgi:hypothetical protein
VYPHVAVRMLAVAILPFLRDALPVSERPVYVGLASDRGKRAAKAYGAGCTPDGLSAGNRR